ncbi:atp synthase f1 [Fusarium albosuccineum]|uniref:Serine protease n=1 Tax=Fusarium albosuccineum TaxID=1237068 RepID=A0A8H4LER5_9HYPO|nr:atp synthase f1 [Fusarium albosuccineum]
MPLLANHDSFTGTDSDADCLLSSPLAVKKAMALGNQEEPIAALAAFESEDTSADAKKKLVELPKSSLINGAHAAEGALTTHGATAPASRNSANVLHESHDPSGAHAVKRPLATYGAAGQAFCKAVGWVLPCKVSEMRLNKNPQVEVPVDEIKPGGPFRGIVRIVAIFPNGTKGYGTGFLIDHDVVATSGHVLADDDGNALKVLLFAGTGGPDGTMERREGDWVVVHGNWFSRGEHRDSNDIGFIRLSAVKPLEYMTTPVSDGRLTGTVYGYPGDFPAHARGKRLCKSTSPLWFPYEASRVLQHEADTEVGSSGGPITDAKGSVIAVHAGHPKYTMINEAVPINRNGNDFDIFIRIAKFLALCRRDRAGLITPADDVILEDGQRIAIEGVVNVPNIGDGVAFEW